MAEEVRDALASLLDDLDPKRHDPDEEVLEYDRRSMSMRIDVDRLFMLQQIADHVGSTKTGVGQQIFEAAILNAHRRYGLPHCLEVPEQYGEFTGKTRKLDPIASDVQQKYNITTQGFWSKESEQRGIQEAEAILAQSGQEAE